MAQLELTPAPLGPLPSRPPPPNVATPVMSGIQPTNISVAWVKNQGSAVKNPYLVGYDGVQNAAQCIPDNYKNLLQHYAQKARLLLPDYTIINEGLAHAPQFRATVSIGGKQYTSPNTFAQRKAAEQDAARHAMENMPPITNKEELPNIREDKMFCKSILNELMMKISVDNPTYYTVQPDASIHAFKCTVVFNGVSYTGEVGRNKKEAEQLGARAVIASLLESEHKTVLSEIIKSKVKLYASINKVKDYSHISTGDMLIGVNTGKEISMENSTASEQSSIVKNSTTEVAQPPHHEFKKPGVEHPTTCVPASSQLSSIEFVPPKLQEHVQLTGGKKRKRKSKNKANKHFQVGSQAPLVLAHPSQVS